MTGNLGFRTSRRPHQFHPLDARQADLLSLEPELDATAQLTRHVILAIGQCADLHPKRCAGKRQRLDAERSEEHTSELQSPDHLVCRLLLEKKKTSQSRRSDSSHALNSRWH